MVRSMRVAAALMLIASVAAWTVPLRALAQDDAATGPLCVLSTDEVTQLTGVPIVERAAAGLECAYSADPAERSFQVVLSIIPPDATGFEGAEDGLFLVRIDHPLGKDAEIGGLPAWIAPEGVWVDVGDDLLTVWLNLLFDATPPPMPATAVAIAEAALPRYLAAPRPSPTPRSAAAGIVSRFPEELAGQPLDVMVLPGPDLFAQLEAFAGSAQAVAGLADLRTAVEAMGATLDAVEGGQAFAFDFDAGTNLDILALQVPGMDVAPLLDPALAAFVDFSGGTPESRTVAGREVIVVDEPPGGEDGHRWFLVDGDVLWALSGDPAMAEALLTALPSADGPAR